MRRARLGWARLLLCLLPACGGEPPPPVERETIHEAQAPSPGRDPWEDARLRGIEFRALGQEPGWFLEIDEGRSVRLVWDYLERDATMPAPAPSLSDGVRVYAVATDTHALTVRIENRPCQDVMSGFSFPRTVIVTIDGRELRGCGRELQ